jgi:hypothetical protein
VWQDATHLEGVCTAACREDVLREVEAQGGQVCGRERRVGKGRVAQELARLHIGHREGDA